MRAILEAVTVLAERLTAQLLAGPPARSAVEVAERLLAVQGQDARGARLAVRARTRGLTAADVDRALTEERTLLITWLNRGTLHLVASEDYPWLHALTTPPLLTGNRRRLAELGVSPADADRAVARIARDLADDGPLTRAQLGERVAETGVETAGQALVHLLVLASVRGLAIRGPMVGKQHAYVHVADWLGPAPKAPDRVRSLAELARRYLLGHGPATDRDLAKWSGLPLRDARTGLKAIARSLERRDDGLLALKARPKAARLPPPRLLGAFDPLLLGWTSRAEILGNHESTIVTGGLFRPFMLAEGRAVGTWKLADNKVELEPLEPLSHTTSADLDAERTAVERYLKG